MKNIRHLTRLSLNLESTFFSWPRALRKRFSFLGKKTDCFEVHWILGRLSNEGGDGNENGKRAIGLNWQNNNYGRASLLFFLTFPCGHCTATTWKCGEREHKTTTFFFFKESSIRSFRIHLQKKIANILRIKQDGIIAIKFEAAQLHFSIYVFVAVAVDVA